MIKDHPAGVLHNGAESGIDWTGGVAFPQPALPVNSAASTVLSDSTAWSYSNISVQPDGETINGAVAYKITETASGVNVCYAFDSVSLAEGTISAVVKAGSVSQCWLYRSSAAVALAVFDLATGTVVGGSGTSFKDCGISALGNGWYRIWMATSSVTTSNMGIGLGGGVGSIQHTGTGSGTLFAGEWQFELGLKAPRFFNPPGIINTLDKDWYFPDTPANPHAQRHVSDGFGNILKIDRRLHYDRAMLGLDLDKIRNYTADPQGLLADNFNRADQSTPGLDWLKKYGLGFVVTGGAIKTTSNASTGAIFLRPLRTASAEVEANFTGVNTSFFGVGLHWDEVANTGYYVAANSSATTLYLYRFNGGSTAVTTKVYTPSANVNLRFRMVNGLAYVWVNGVQEFAGVGMTAGGDYTSQRLPMVFGYHTASNLTDFKARDI